MVELKDLDTTILTHNFLAALYHIHIQGPTYHFCFFDMMFWTGLRQGANWPFVATLRLQDCRLLTDCYCSGLPPHPLSGFRRQLSVSDWISLATRLRLTVTLWVLVYISLHNANAFPVQPTWAAHTHASVPSCLHRCSLQSLKRPI